jgi:hypothetical protein
MIKHFLYSLALLLGFGELIFTQKLANGALRKCNHIK